MKNFQEKVGFIWSVADLLRGPFKPSEYGKIILPLTVLRRLDCVLEPSKAKVLERAKVLPERADEKMKDLMLCQAAGPGMTFYNTSRFVLQPTETANGRSYVSLLSDQDQIAANLTNLIAGFSPNAREIFIDKFKFGDQIDRLDENNLLYLVLGRFTEIELHPDVVDNIQMGYIFEELIRRFSEESNEKAGDHFTPREIIRLMVNLLFADDAEVLTKRGVIRTLYDPACGTGGMLSVAENYLRELNPSATLKVFGQELNPESYAVCKSDMLIKGEDATNIKFGNSLTQDGLVGEMFDYFLCNPPFGVDWKSVEKKIREEYEDLGMAGRFGAGLPRIGDGALLFLQHMISKFRQDGTGSRLAIVFNGSPLFTGSAGSGESEIRRWVIENDWLEAIVGLPDQLFYNTGIATYVWVVTNRKPKDRRGKIQLIDATSLFVKMRKSLGNKRNEIGDGTNGRPDQIAEITRLYGDFEEGETSKIFDNEDFGYWRVTVERPLRLNFAVDDERLSRLRESSGFQGLAQGRKKGAAGLEEAEAGQRLQKVILAALEGLRGTPLVKNRDEFTGRLKEVFRRQRLDLKAPLLKTLLAALSERDETADICTDARGNPEPDPDLRDYENVPLKDDIRDYFRREVLPHVPDAWIDEDKTKKGYEIPFTRHFYRYTPLRPLEEIEAEITALEEEIQGMLKEVMA
jgi:type I restriction enzyme M protein